MTFEVDDEMIKAMHSRKFMTKFYIPTKLREYSQHPNSNIEARENVLVFQKWDENSFTMEDFRLIMLYGCTAMQYINDQKKCIINLKAFPDGEANWDRSVLITAVKEEEDYAVTTIVATNNDLTDINQVFFSRTKDITLPFVYETLASVKDDLPGNCYALFMDHVKDLEPIFARDMNHQQLTFDDITAISD